jgi:hypothetical protein
MRRPPKVDPTDPAALSAWLAETRALTADLHALAVDATARKGQRSHAKSYLRELARRRFRSLEAQLTALAPASAPPSTAT